MTVLAKSLFSNAVNLSHEKTGFIKDNTPGFFIEIALKFGKIERFHYKLMEASNLIIGEFRKLA